MPKKHHVSRPLENLLRSTIPAIFPRERATLVELKRLRNSCERWGFRFSRNFAWCLHAAKKQQRAIYGGGCPLYPGLEMAFYNQCYPTYKKRYVPHIRVVAVDGDFAIIRRLNDWGDLRGPDLGGYIPIVDLLWGFTPTFYEMEHSRHSPEWARERAAWLSFKEKE